MKEKEGGSKYCKFANIFRSLTGTSMRYVYIIRKICDDDVRFKGCENSPVINDSALQSYFLFDCLDWISSHMSFIIKGRSIE